MSQGFASLGVSPELERALSARGIVEPFRIQTLVVPDALAGTPTLVLGKSGGKLTSLGAGSPTVEQLSTAIDQALKS